MPEQYRDLINIFNDTFSACTNTRLIKGGDEPLYSPADDVCEYHQIIFAHGFYASALHEIAHWCLAGPARRLKEDFGYWYTPDGRDQIQQEQFEQVEIKPQAIEWALSVSTGKCFDVSIDNLSGMGTTDRIAFKRAVYQQVIHYLNSGFPNDAQKFIVALANFYQTPLPLTRTHFVL
ncbi:MULTISPECIES: elongation factor P hydroxylase [unclassified Colwellia]|uniref:elongation factor P hydroxylase n=1 Tax=unclassified Colwellia TaxID=196834 RepID=UPI0015F609A8|nr:MULTISPECIES: elongation factor P hydroxylase [unclassified Colwellia]MBA6231765.1 elongation factor P hydroxylase [Colwellia sp. MB02u-7]MBA6235720.1 elongation factor P hydroxylase [Colwellia sp. MB02u-11]MBA6254791.1 elongation factor P hydroxylase [Colwellia sp. MB3u-28]MBA6259284.1 elongation factor P hydroxylase [Colwellia sp. MB3u-41]MBA6298809.1 elongation factor P hydroxylase [Colwellia sp. MB3u-22]